MFKHILIPTDCSPASAKAIKAGDSADLARLFDERSEKRLATAAPKAA